MVIRATFVFIGLCFLSACATSSHVKPRHFLDAVFGSDPYEDVFERMTKERRVYSEFEPTLTVFATYWNADLREAYIRELAERYRLSGEEETARAKEQLQENEEFFVFILSAYTRELEWNDFDKMKSLWRITLESPDEKIQLNPERIEVVSAKDEQAIYFYKRMERFGKTYRVRFLKGALRGAPEIVLHISGPRGAVAFPFSGAR